MTMRRLLLVAILLAAPLMAGCAMPAIEPLRTTGTGPIDVGPVFGNASLHDVRVTAAYAAEERVLRVEARGTLVARDAEHATLDAYLAEGPCPSERYGPGAPVPDSPLDRATLRLSIPPRDELRAPFVERLEAPASPEATMHVLVVADADMIFDVFECRNVRAAALAQTTVRLS